MATTKKTPAKKAAAKRTATTKTASAGPSDKAVRTAHAAVIKAKAANAKAIERRAAARTPADRTKAQANVTKTRDAMVTAIETRREAMRTYRAAGDRVVDLQAICGFASSGATLFALNGGKTAR